MKKKLDILEVLSGTGIRSIRYMKEISSLNKLIANDIDPTAVDLIKKNFVFNDLSEEQYKSNFLYINIF